MKIFRDQAYGTDERQKLDVYGALGGKHPVVIFWHGGSWQRGDKRWYGFIGRTLARMGYVAVIPNFRLYPQVRFPTFVEDAAAAVKWTSEHIAEYYGDPKSVFLMGHSSGAHMASLLGLDEKYLKAQRVDLAAIKGVIGLSGAYNFSPKPELQPIFNLPSQDTSWNPISRVDHPTLPFLLLSGRLDWTVRPYNTITLAKAIRDSGGSAKAVIYPHLEHMGIIVPFIPGFGWIAPVRRRIREFIKAHQ